MPYTDLDKRRAYRRSYYRSNRADNPRPYLLRGARHRAKARGLPFDITLDDVVIPDRCPILGIPLINGKGRRTDNSPSLDRIVPEWGYSKGNVAVISWRANNIKSDGTAEEHRMIAEWMEGQ